MEPLDELRIEIMHLRENLNLLEQKLNSLANEQPSEKIDAAPVFTPPVYKQPIPKPQAQTVIRPPAATKQPNPDLEAIIGGNWLNRIGAATLIIGMAFFLKYAIDNNWINETGRIIIGLLVGMGCIWLGEKFQKKKLPIFAHGLSGAGVAILYFTIFAAYSFYSLLPQLPAFMIMIVVTAAAIALSVRYDAISIAALGILGGFMTPALLSGGHGSGGDSSNIGVLIYIIILDLGILGVTRFKNWRSLNIISLIGTVIIFTNATGSYNYKKGLSIEFATIYFLIFAAQAYVQNVMARRDLTGWDTIMAVAPPILYFAHCDGLLAGTEYAMALGPFAILMAAAYVGLSHKVFMTAFEDRKLCAMYLTIAAAFLTIAIPLQLRGYWLAWGWGIEAGILSYIGFHLNSARTRGVALGVLWLAVITLLGNTAMSITDGKAQAFADMRMPTYLLLTALTSYMIYFYSTKQKILTESERFLFPASLVISAALLLLIGLSTDVYVLAEAQIHSLNASVILTLLWLAYGLAAIMAGIHYKHRPIRIFALLLLGVTLTKTYLSDVWWLPMAWRIIAFIALGVMLLMASYFYQKYRPQIAQIVSGDKNENN